MRRPIAVVMALAVLGFQLAAPDPAAAAAFVHSCQQGSQGVFQAYVDSSAAGAEFGAVAGDVVVRDLAPCLTPNGASWSAPFVAGANMQIRGQSRFVAQVGYMECKNCVGVPNDGRPHFMYTGDPDQSGRLFLVDWAGAALVGERYRFRLTSSNGIFKYCIRNLTRGTAYQCKTHAGAWPAEANQVWWGTETENTSSAMGPVCCADIDMRWMQYKRADFGNQWWARSGINTVGRNAWHTSGAQSWPFYWHSFIYNANDLNGDGARNDRDGMKSHTDSH